MSGSSLEVDPGSLSTSATRLQGAAAEADSSTSSALHKAEKLGATGAHKVFAAFVDPIIDGLRHNLPSDIKLLITSYANSLLQINAVTSETDQTLAAQLRSPSASTTARTSVVEGPASFSNASIVSVAASYPQGSYGGQCRVFVDTVVSKATNGKVDLQAYANPSHDYFTALEQQGTQITDVSALRPGDVVQIGEFESDSNLHTFIIDGTPYQKPDGSWWVHVIDSNAKPSDPETVWAHDRPISLSDEERAYRLGTV